MPSTTVKIINKRGLHARAAAKFATTAANFSCTIQARCPGSDQWVDGKSVMSLMLLAAGHGSDLEVYTNGSDEQPALDAICELIANRFEEGE